MKLSGAKAMKKLLITLASCLYWGSAVFSASVWADDTEIYVVTNTSSGSSTAQPNVLFVFDTSGSMDDDITTIADYDPSETYADSSDPDYYYFYEQDFDFVGAVHKDYIACQALKDTIAAQPDNPVFNDRIAYWSVRTGGRGRGAGRRNERWRDITGRSASISDTSPLECESDSGVHGSNAAPTPNSYATNSSGPFTSDSSNVIDWADRDQLMAVSPHYHDYLNDSTITTTRKKTDIMKDAAKDLVDYFNGLNFGLMRFDGGSGGYVIHHFADITPAANKTAIKNSIDTLPASGTTPLTETLWEAGRYYRGDSVDYGTNSVAAATTSGSYNSPMTHECQKNHIIYLTDGEPYSDSGRDSQISTLTGNSCSHSDGATQASNTCFDEYAEWLKNTDHDSVLDDTQDITLHAVGFDIELDLLKTAAQKGGGKLYNATNATELKAAFNQIILSILNTENTFAAPAVTVNAYNNLQHRDTLYYAIFRPEITPRWPGNVKRYRVTSDAVIKDQDDNDAIDPNTGFFDDDARSFWSATADGHTVAEGGFAAEMSTARDIFTYTGSTAPSNVSLNASAHIFDDTNTAITNTLLGLPASTPAADRQVLMEWMQGDDVEFVNDPNPVHEFIADPLHSRPQVVTYGGTESSPDDTIYFGNNMGMLHAIDADDGSEEFAFMPQALLPNGHLYLENDVNVTDKVYGLDGEITIWRKENPNDADATIESGEGDHVYLYIGMRRGGNNYYALDVTNRSNPKLMWRIEGGAGDFTDLAQTWSAAKLSRILWNCDSSGENCTEKDVLVFGGGHDTIHDTTTTQTTDDTGAAVYIVDATTGALLWSAGRDFTPARHDLELSDMENSIAGDITLADIDNDGFIDIMFGIDIMGHVWRFDINSETTTAANFATGGIIADLGDYDSNSSNDAENLRRFYYAPDVALFTPRGQEAFFTISAPSGYRSHPKDTTVTDRIYTIFDPNVFEPPKDGNGAVDYTVLDDSDSDPLDTSDLFDATSALADKSTNAPHGWYKTFQGTDEKGLARATTFGGALIYTTYLPPGSTGGSTVICGGDIGSGRTYVVDALTGGGLIDNGGTVSEYIELANQGIPPAATVIYTDASETYTDGQGTQQTNRKTKPIVCVGTECFDDLLPTSNPLSRTFWREN